MTNEEGQKRTKQKPGVMQERLKEFIYRMRITQSEFEKKIGKATGFINHLRNTLSVSAMDDILTAYPRLRRDWLMFGEEPMLYPEGGTPVPADTQSQQPSLSRMMEIATKAQQIAIAAQKLSEEALALARHYGEAGNTHGQQN